jgi:hypothetical protein
LPHAMLHANCRESCAALAVANCLHGDMTVSNQQKVKDVTQFLVFKIA